MKPYQFRNRLSALLNETLDDGPGPRMVAKLTATSLGEFIANEAGGYAPAAIEEAVAELRAPLLADQD